MDRRSVPKEMAGRHSLVPGRALAAPVRREDPERCARRFRRFVSGCSLGSGCAWSKLRNGRSRGLWLFEACCRFQHVRGQSARSSARAVVCSFDRCDFGTQETVEAQSLVLPVESLSPRECRDGFLAAGLESVASSFMMPAMCGPWELACRRL